MQKLCPNCNALARKLFSVNDINQKMSDETFDYFRCNTCSLIFEFPVPKDIQKYYGSAYSAYRKPEADKIKDQALQGINPAKISVIKKYVPGKKILEIGPGYGEFSYAAIKEGYVVDAIEMDADCCKYLEEVIGVRRAINSVDITAALELVDGGYDAIVMWHVLEHLPNPWEVIQSLNKILSSNGVVIVATPNPSSLQLKVFGKYWKHIDAPRHLMLIPMDVLIKKMKKAGLSKIEATTKDEASSFFHSYGWWMTSLNNYLTEAPNSLISRLLSKQRLRQYITYRCYKYLLAPIERTEGLGCAYLAVFNKVEKS